MFNWEGFLIDPKIQQCTHKIQQCGDRDNFGRVKGENRKFKNMGSLKGISHSLRILWAKKRSVIMNISLLAEKSFSYLIFQFLSART